MQTGWFADENVFDMQIERYRPHRSARRFDAGTPPVPNIYAGVAGVGLIADVGRARDPGSCARPRRAAGRRARRARRHGRAPPPHGPLVCIRSTDAPALVAAVAEDDVVASERDSNLRISLHLYNTDEDVDAVLASLARNRALLGVARDRRRRDRRLDHGRLAVGRRPRDRLAGGGSGGRPAPALHGARGLREAHRRDRGVARRRGRRRRGAGRAGRHQRHRARAAGRGRCREPARDDPPRAGARPARRRRECPSLEQRLAAGARPPSAS